MDDCRPLYASKHLRGIVKLTGFGQQTSGCCGPSHKVPRNLLSNNHYFCICLPYLPEEVFSSWGVVSVIPRLQVRSL